MTIGPPPNAGGLWSSPPAARDLGPPAKARAEAPHPASDPSRNLLRAAGILALLLIAVVVNAALNRDDGLNPIAVAADRISAEIGARMGVEAVYTSPDLPGPLIAKGNGIYNARTQRSRVWLELPVPAAGKVRVESVGDAHTVYVRGFGISNELPPGRGWIAFDPLLGRDDSTIVGGGGGTQSQLEMMRAVSDDVEELGEGEVRGVNTTGYRGEVDFSQLATLYRKEGEADLAELYERYAERSPDPISIEAWIDKSGIARRLRMTMDLASESGPALKMDMRIDFYDFGGTHPVRLPKPREVFDTTPILRAETHLIDGTMFLGRWPASGEPLSPAAFHRRANRICRRLERKDDALEARSRPEVEEIERVLSGDPNPEALTRAMRAFSAKIEAPGIRATRRAARALQRIEPPPGLVARYRRMLSLYSRDAELSIAALRSFQLGNASSGKELFGRADRLEHKGDLVAKRLGLPACIDDDEGGNGGASATPA